MYKIYFTAKGYKTKSFQVDARNIPKYYTTKVYNSSVDITLDAITAENKDVYQPKFGVMKFNPNVEGFEWDIEYSAEEIFKKKVANGDSLLVNKPPKMTPASSQILIFKCEGVSPKNVNLKKGANSMVFQKIVAGMKLSQSVFYANIGNADQAITSWNDFQKESGKVMDVSESFSDLYTNFAAYEKFADTNIAVRLGEWMELSYLMLQTKSKVRQKSYYLNNLSVFLVRFDQSRLRDHELSMFADLQKLIQPIKDFNAKASLGNKKTHEADLIAKESEIKELLFNVLKNFYSKTE
jgi:2C-methyl-D-erythritol 2,4-cyclodiphosphate synthase